MDSVRITQQELKEIFAWKELHKDEVRKSYCPMKAVRLDLPDSKLSIKCYRENDKVTFHVWRDGQREGKFEIEILGIGYGVTKNKDNLVHEMIVDVVTLYCTVMALFVVGSEYVEKVPDASEKAVKTAPRPAQSKASKSYSYVVRHIYPAKPAGETTRAYHKHVESFGVRGHYRHYKSGKVIWVNEFRKGEGNKHSKEYKMGRIEND